MCFVFKVALKSDVGAHSVKLAFTEFETWLCTPAKYGINK